MRTYIPTNLTVVFFAFTVVTMGIISRGFLHVFLRIVFEFVNY